MKQLLKVYFTILFCFLTLPLHAQLEKTALAMLGSPVDPASIGRGGAGAAHSDLLSGVSVNPAHVHQLNEWESFYNQQFFGSALVPNLRYFMAGGAYRLSEKDVVGATVRRFGFGIPVSNLGNTGPGDTYEMSIALIYGRQISRRFSTAVNLQYLRNSRGDIISLADPDQSQSINSFAVDLGFLFKGLWTGSTIEVDLPVNPELADMQKRAVGNGWNFGLSLLNFGPRIAYIDEAQSDPLPLTIQLGTTWYALRSPLLTIDGHADFQKLLLSFENSRAESPFDAIVNGWKDKTLKEGTYHFGADFMLFSVFLLQYGHIFAPGQVREDYRHTNSFGLAVQTRYFSVHFSKWLENASQSITNDNNYLLGVTFGEIEL